MSSSQESSDSETGSSSDASSIHSVSTVKAVETSALRFSNVPAKNSKEFIDYTTLAKPPGTSVRGGISLPDNAAKSALVHETYASFGSNGTTASVNAYGNLMQMSRYLGVEPSGFWSVDIADTSRPWYVQPRMEELLELSKQPERGIRLDLEKLLKNNLQQNKDAIKPALEFIQDRWPRFSFNKSSMFQLSLQYFCHEGIVFQKYVLKRKSLSDSVPDVTDLEICANVAIRDLDFSESKSFEQDPTRTEQSAGPHEKSLILHRDSQRDSKRICLILMAFVNGIAQKIGHKDTTSTENLILLDKQATKSLKERTTVEITLAYKLKELSPDEPWKSGLIPAGYLKSMKKRLSNQACETATRLKFSSNQYLDFAIRRNLEHILSVCSIPIQNEIKPDTPANSNISIDNEPTAIALTCGDLSGHRVASSASFFAFRFLTFMLGYLNMNDRGSSKKPNIRDFSQRDDCDCEPKGSEPSCGNCKELENYIEELRNRIEQTILGHLVWVCKRVKAKDGRFPPHMWVTGKSVQNTDYLPPRLLADTPFQFIKLEDYQVAMTEPRGESTADEIQEPPYLGEIFTDLKKNVRIKIKPWIRTLQNHDKRGKFAFTRLANEPGVDNTTENLTYRLADHCWIYLGLKSVQALGLEEELNRSISEEAVDENKSASEEAVDENKSTSEETDDGLACNYTPDKIRRNVIKRFTIENSVSQQRMLATTRTAYESRFLLHAKDTTLFYAMDKDFFEDENMARNRNKGTWKSKTEVWRNTVEAQQFHEDNQKLDKEKPLWYALALTIGANKRRINKLSSGELVHAAFDVLMSSSSSNGLFPGLLDERKMPISYKNEFDRDEYWHATFEIPVLLWMHRKNYQEKLVPENTQRAADHVTNQLAATTNRLNEAVETAVQSKGTNSGFAQNMRKKLPFTSFNDLVDHKGLVEISDDWLHPGPRSLDFTFKPDMLAVFQDLVRTHAYLNETVKSDMSSQGANSKVLRDAIETYKWDDKAFSDPMTRKGIIIDIPKSERRVNENTSAVKDIEISEEKMQNNVEILRQLGKTRTVFEAKKRIVWLPYADKETALVCAFASPEPERENMSAFFDRHASYEKYFFDSTTATLNEWETEIHLSFCCLVKEKSYGIKCIPNSSNIELQGTGTNHDVQAKFSRSVMSFRFVGDFFDRYWTCHFLEHSPHLMDQTRLNKFGHFRSLYSSSKPPWQQRKVLELWLVNEILEEMTNSTNEILDWARNVLLVAENDGATKPPPLFSRSKTTVEAVTPSSTISFTTGTLTVKADDDLNPLTQAFHHGIRFLQPGGSDSYFSINERWRMCEQVLQAVVDDLSENLERIEDWKRREKDREPQKPRWTRNDEKTYRPVLTKLLVYHQRKIRDLERSKASIEAFRESLTGRLASIREDINFRGSENINLFTYVTVVFLPLGFATGIFSMSGAPEKETLINMIVMAVVALLVTIIALINAKNLAKVFIKPLLHIFSIGVILLTYPITYPFFRFIAIPLKEFWQNRDLETLSHLHDHLNPAQRARDNYDKIHKVKKGPPGGLVKDLNDTSPDTKQEEKLKRGSGGLSPTEPDLERGSPEKT